VDADFQSKLNAQVASMPSRVTATRAIYQHLGGLLERYHAGAPVGFLSAIVELESGGKMVAGDPGLGEYGVFQVTASTPERFGLLASLRTTLEGNVYLGALEYAVAAVELALFHPLIVLGTPDSWRLARLSFAIGGNGTRRLITAAQPRVAGQVYDAVRAFVRATGGMALGSQSASKVAYRVELVDLTWQVGQLALPSPSGLPSIPPAPPGIHPVIPPAVIDRMRQAQLGQVVGAAAIAAVAYVALG
jgi:hypothetical protein